MSFEQIKEIHAQNEFTMSNQKKQRTIIEDLPTKF